LLAKLRKIFEIVNNRKRLSLVTMRTGIAYETCDLANQPLSCLQPVTQLLETPRQHLARA